MQSQEVTLSQEILSRSDDRFALLGQLNDTILLFEENNFDYSLHVFNDKLELLFEKELFFEKQKIHFNGFFPGINDFTLIYSYESRFQLHVKAVKFDIRGNIKDSLLLYKEREYIDKEDFSYVLSTDKTKLVLIREAKLDGVECIAFDLIQHTKMWQRTLVFEEYRIDYDLNAILLTNRGELVLAFEKYNHAFRRTKHYQELVFISETGESYFGITIDFQGKLSTSFDLEWDEKNQEVIVAGLYAPKSNTRSEGYFLYKLTGSGITQPLSFFPFSTELLKLHSGKRKNPKKYIPDLFVKEMVIRNDGGLVMISEMQKEVARESVRRRYIDYHFEDMVVLALHPDGKLFWDDLIRKYQLSFDDEAKYSSFFLFQSPSRLKLIFNDEIKSENTVSEYSFSPLGNGVRESLLSTDLHQLKLLFEDAVQISSSSFLVPSMYNGKYRIIKLEY